MPRFLFQYVRLFLGSLLRVLALLVGKDPEAASDELLALRSAYVHPLRLARARRRRSVTVRTHREMRHLLAAPWLPYQHGFDAAREAVTAVVRPEAIETVGRRSTTLDQAPEEAEDLDDGPPFLARRPWFATVIVLIVLAAFASRGLQTGTLHGGALPPRPGTAGDWWRLLFEGSHDVGQPSSALPPVFVIPLAVLATPFWNHPGAVVSFLMLLAVPLAALTAHRLGRQVTPHRAARIVWAVTYGLGVAGIGAISQGRIGTVVALIILPIIVNTAWQLAEKPGRQLALRLGIWIALASAFAPVVLLLSFGGLLILLYSEGKWVSRQLVVSAVVPLVLLGPWLWQRALRPWRMWWEAGYPVPGTGTVLDVVLGRAGGPVSAPAWLTIPLLVLAVAAILPRRTRFAVELAWLVALLGLAVALFGTLVTYSTHAGPADIVPWVGIPVALWIGGLSTAVLLAAPEVFAWRRLPKLMLVLAALVLPLGLGSWWLGRGEADPIDSGLRSVVPVFLAERPGDTLVLTGTIARGVDYRVVAGGGPFLGQEAVSRSSGQNAELSAAIRRILAQATPADVKRLSAVGIDAIYAPDVDPEVARRIDAAAYLAPAGSDRPGSRVWTLSISPGHPHVSAPWWHRAITGVQLLLWLVAIIMTAPVRRRAVAEDLDESEEEGAV